MSHQVLAMLCLLAPLGAAVVLLLVAPLRRDARVASTACIATTAVSLAAALVLAFDFVFGVAPVLDLQWPWLPAGGYVLATIGLYVDGVSASMAVVVALVALCVQVYSLGYMAADSSPDRGRYFTYHALFAFSMLGLVLAPNLLQLFVFWELVGLSSYLLIGYYWVRPSAARAAVKAFWVTKLADIGLLLALMVLYTKTGSFDWQVSPASALSAADTNLVAGLLLVAVIGKSAQFPLHVWLPNAMEGPTPVSALLHAATMVAAGVYLLVRAYPIVGGATDVLTFMAYLGAFTALFAAFVACFQDDIKKVLAYSTCSQLGYMIAGLGSGSMLGGYFHLTTHAAFKALLFLGAGSVIHAVHSNDIKDMGGLAPRMRPTALMFILGALALVGFPGFSGFFSKDLVLEELLAAGHIVPMAAGVLAAGLTALYMTRVVLLTFFGAPSAAASEAHESPAVMLGPMAILALIAAIGGLLLPAMAGIAGVEAGFHVTPVGIAATVAGLLGIGLGFSRYRPSRRDAAASVLVTRLAAIARSGAVDRSATWLYRQGLNRCSAWVGWFDRYIIDGLINLAGWSVLTAAERVRLLQSGRVGDYVYAVVIGLVVLTAAGVLVP